MKTQPNNGVGNTPLSSAAGRARNCEVCPEGSRARTESPLIHASDILAVSLFRRATRRWGLQPPAER